MTQSVLFRSRFHFHHQVAVCDGFGNRRHLLQISHHVGEGTGQFADFILTLGVDFDVVIQIAGIADLVRYGHQLRQGIGDRRRRAIGDKGSEHERQDQSRNRDRNRPCRRALIRNPPVFYDFLVFFVGYVQKFSRILDPRGSILLQVKNL